MITIWCRHKSQGALDLVRKIKELGHDAKRVIGPHAPVGAVRWGCGGGNKYIELQRLEAAGIPVPPHSLRPKLGWLARRFRHQEANDLLAERKFGDYYVQYVPTTREFRVHVFGKKSVRAGMKVPRTSDPHPRFRSWSGGWRLSYGSDCQEYMTPAIRKLAVKAVDALEYDFGAVDIAIKEGGGLVVWEVNSAPGLEGRTIEIYARYIIDGEGKWY